MKSIRLGFLFVGMILLAACTPWVDSILSPRLTASPEPNQTPQETETPASESVTPSESLAEPGTESTPAAESAPATPRPDPLKLVFPQAEPPPVSAWRPPQYPNPWAPTSVDHFYFARPIGADEVNWPDASYRYGGIFFEDEVHTGVDIPAPPGTPVLAAEDGKVIWAGYGLYRGVPGDRTDPYGQAVVIRHDFGYQGKRLYTVYGHLARVDVPRGQFINQGDTLGLVGNTGRTTGPHLHFEIRWGQFTFFSTLNPELWLVPPQGWGVLAARLMDTRTKLLDDYLIAIHSLESGQIWRAKTYDSSGPLNLDPYYRENFVVSDLPAGRYEVRFSYGGRLQTLEVEIDPGRVTYFTFQGWEGFDTQMPPLPGEDFAP